MGEDVLSKFSTVYEIEMYLKSTEGFGGEGDLVSKFGLDVRDEVIFTVHRDRFELATDMSKPLEGDLIYLPINKGLFEIKFVEHEQPFYQSGKNYSFDITCELFQYAEEQLDTGVSEIDSIEREQSAAIDLVMTAGGSGTFSVDEAVYQGPSLANATGKGIVVSWNTTTRTLRVNDTSGTFAASTNVTGIQVVQFGHKHQLQIIKSCQPHHLQTIKSLKQTEMLFLIFQNLILLVRLLNVW